MVPPVGSLGQTSGKDWTGLRRGGAGSCALRKIPSRAPRGNEELLLEAMTLGHATQEASWTTDRREQSSEVSHLNKSINPHRR